jgi:NAD(P)-dependent dehydrogenase (short-subunit alcohol dehydrogenase family)
MSHWSNKVVVITGGSSGFGLELAEAFARAGARLVIGARNAERLEEAAESLRKFGGEVLPVVVDVTVDADVKSFIEQAVENYGAIDALVNNAGKSMRGRVTETTPEQFQELWDINFLSAVRCTQAALPHLLATGGHIVNIGSLASKVTAPFLGAYPASKFPLAAYSQQLRLELHESNVHVLLVCPGPMQRNDGDTRYAEPSSDLPESARRPGGAKIKTIDPTWLAGRVVRACEKRELELIVPGYVRWLMGIAQLWPSWGDWLIRRKTK